VFHAALAAGLSIVLISGGLPPSIHAADPVVGLPQPSSTPAPGTPAQEMAVNQAAVTGGVITLPRTGMLTAAVVSASAGASSDFGLSQPTGQALIANATFNVGASATVGTFTAGTTLVFYISTPEFGTTYLSTSDHAQVVSDGPEAWIISWEDFNDFDFNDLVTRISYAAAAGPPDEQTYGIGSGLHGPAVTHKESEPVDTATGNYVSQATDVALPGRGLAFAFTRTYNSLDTAVGPLGPGWRASYGAALVLEAAGTARFIAEDGAQYVFTPDGGGGFVAPAGSTDRLAPTATGYELRRRDQVRYHLRARQYDPTTGRFTAVDPVSPGIGTPAIGAYVYVGNNPVRYTDPSGRNPLCGGILAFAEFGPVDWAAALACLAVTGALFVEAANVVRLASDLVRWPLTPSGTLQEPPLVNVGPQPPPQPNRPPFRCTTKGQKIVCVTLAGLTFVYYNTANRDSAPTPQPGPPPDVPPVIPRGSRK
jgi:RHS repeat-associated protein